LVRIRSKRLSYYVYVLFRPWDGSPCYVGKGRGNRWASHECLGLQHPNPHLANIFAKAQRLGLQMIKKKAHKNLSEQQAFDAEINLIASIGRGKLGPLVNMTDGGEGVSGYSPSQEMRDYFRGVTKRSWQNPKCRAQRVAGIKRALADPVVKKARAAKIKAVWDDPKKRAEQSARMELVLQSPECRARKSEIMKERNSSPEARERLSQASRARWAAPGAKAEHNARLVKSWSSLTDAERKRRGANISAGKRKSFLLKKEVLNAQTT
jgi:hypothetical protein